MTEAKSVGKEIAELAIESIDLEKFSHGILDRVLEPALDKLVADSKTPVDDVLKASLYPALKVELKKLISKEIADLKEKIGQ